MTITKLHRQDDASPLPSESTPLVSSKPSTTTTTSTSDKRLSLFLFLEAQTPNGLHYESFTILLILLSVLTFILGSLFLPQYNTNSNIAYKCGLTCDAIFFGNYPDNALQSLGIGATSLVEIFIVGVFTIDYLLRFYTADLIHVKYTGPTGRIKFLFSFFSLVDLASTIPFYVDSFLLPNTDLAASNFLRMFRLLRMLKMEGRYDLALGMIDDVLYEQRGVLGTALFVGMTVWGVLSSFFYLAERKNGDMIYCLCEDVDTSVCSMDEFGFVDCTEAGCPPPGDDAGQEVCWNVYQSIVLSSFWTLMELFGEFPLVDQHSMWGKVLGTITAVFACAVFALPVGIFASGFEAQIAARRRQKEGESGGSSSPMAVKEGGGGGVEEDETEWELVEVVGDISTTRGIVYNYLHLQNSASAKMFEMFMNVLIVFSSLAFMLSTMDLSTKWQLLLGWFQFASVAVFTFEYLLFMYSAGEKPKFRGRGLLVYATSFYRAVDLVSILPYWLTFLSWLFVGGSLTPGSVFLLFRLMRFEKYTKAFTSFDDVLRDNLDVLAMTGFSALLLWIFFSSLLYLTERDSLDQDMANYYKSVPHSMWITLLNLSGECPLAHYSGFGKIIVGFIGVFATAIFGVPIGLLGAGFEELVTEEEEDENDESSDVANVVSSTPSSATGAGLQTACYQFVNGIGSKSATRFELSIYALIVATGIIGVVQTVPGYESFFSWLEWVAVGVFTIEYVLRFIGCGADPEFSGLSFKRIRYILSFYSIIDLLAIVPFYIALATPTSWVDRHDEYFRMLRLLRLLKLDKYIPSITLVDDVVRLKRNVLTVSCFAALTLWVIFAGLMYIAEFQDNSMEIDPLPLYGCVDGCTMSDRFSDYFNSFPLTGIHLTGDFPMVEYGGMGRVVLFFIVIAAVGVTSIPSGVIASGFAEIVQSKTKKGPITKDSAAGDDWFDIKYRELDGQSPPSSSFGPTVDRLQFAVKSYLDGAFDERTGTTVRTPISIIGRLFFMLLIVSNILAVVLESIPKIDKYVGNEHGNMFDVFEKWSVLFFTIDYALRLFSAKKSREALFSPWVYAFTFFGLVDILSILPWYVQWILSKSGNINGDEAKVFRIFRIFRVLQLEDFVVAFSKLDNVFRASKDVLKATGLMAVVIWVGSSALFFIFEQNNPNFRSCDASVPLTGTLDTPGCYDFESTQECNVFYPDMCSQSAFTNMPNTMFYVAVFLGGDWGFVDFTWPGKLVCMFLCVAGIALYSIPVGTLFDSFGAVIGLGEEEEEDEETSPM